MTETEETRVDAWIKRLERMLELMTQNDRMQVELLESIAQEQHELAERVAKLEARLDAQVIPVAEYLPRGFSR
jgi:small-conductance mechanosensitive channel